MAEYDAVILLCTAITQNHRMFFQRRGADGNYKRFIHDESARTAQGSRAASRLRIARVPRISCRREISRTAMPGVMATHFGASGCGQRLANQRTILHRRIRDARRLPPDRFRRPARSSPPRRRRSSILPNKDFWLAPVRRDHTLAVFRIQMAWFACALLTFLIVVNQLVYNANQSVPRHLNGAQFTMALSPSSASSPSGPSASSRYFSKVPAMRSL